MREEQEYVDQAMTLRRLSAPQEDSHGETTEKSHMTRVISVTSGKGGVGKTSVVSNMAYEMAKQGFKVLIIDADLGLANIDLHFGLTPQHNLNHFFDGSLDLETIVLDGPQGIKILPAGSGIQTYTNLNQDQKRNFLTNLELLNGEFDIVFIDTEAGISENVTYFNVAAHDILVVTTSDLTAISDAYALMKLLFLKYHERDFHLLVNCTSKRNEALDIYKKLTLVSGQFLDISLNFLGDIPYDKHMSESIRKQKTIVELEPSSRTSNAFRSIIGRLTENALNTKPKGTLQFFWERFFSYKGVVS
ncbi:MAG TPA: MinD/ParA family protein [Desulfohalobiaceae bacterium]|nr:MinD/ParA family protein [Desulfohalobiaceae bacterium]